MSRTASVQRNTTETQISLTLNLDGSGQATIETGIGFFDHMLNLWTRHGLFDVKLTVKGDLEVDCHHTVEDTGIVLGQALLQAMGDKAGIKRYGTAFVPMDEALAMVSLDLSGRAYLAWDVALPSRQVGQFDTEMTEEFLRAFCQHAGVTMHVRLLAGKNAHHIIEAIFKALGRALDEATRQDERIAGVMSTKGTL
ncbi:MAG TPA: imidazoleglycerol-phosphate dehydratase HisB [Patescibacteria group bacterium]|nr:imidazoleglycerol-phosphate dehydratase HisB [Patescibacteria group bacterium]